MDLFTGPHMLVILVIVLLLFGPSKLPQLARSIGRSVRELKEGLSDIGNEPKPEIKKPVAPVETAQTPPSTSDAQPVSRTTDPNVKIV